MALISDVNSGIPDSEYRTSLAVFFVYSIADGHGRQIDQITGLKLCVNIRPNLQKEQRGVVKFFRIYGIYSVISVPHFNKARWHS